jgi:hypothetical protein
LNEERSFNSNGHTILRKTNFAMSLTLLKSGPKPHIYHPFMAYNPNPGVKGPKLQRMPRIFTMLISALDIPFNLLPERGFSLIGW